MTKDDAYRDMENAIVVDSNGLDIGKIKDFTFENFKLKNFIIKGENEVVKGWLNITSEYTLLLPHEMITSHTQGDVKLSVPVKELKSIQEITETEQRFTVTRMIDVFAADGENLGNVVDAIFHKDDHFSLIVGGSKFKEFLSRSVGIGKCSHLFVPFRYISRYNSNLVELNKNKADLGIVLNDIIMDTDGLKLMDQQRLSSHDARMQLYNESFKDVGRSNIMGNY